MTHSKEATALSSWKYKPAVVSVTMGNVCYQGANEANQATEGEETWLNELAGNSGRISRSEFPRCAINKVLSCLASQSSVSLKKTGDVNQSGAVSFWLSLEFSSAGDIFLEIILTRDDSW